MYYPGRGAERHYVLAPCIHLVREGGGRREMRDAEPRLHLNLIGPDNLKKSPF